MVSSCKYVVNILEQNISKIRQEHFWAYKVLNMCLNFFKYIFWEKRKIWTILKWLDIYNDFLTISSVKMFQYSQIVYIKVVTQ